MENEEKKAYYFGREKEMKYTRLTILLGVLVSTLVVGCMLASAQSKWEIIIPQSNFGDKLRATAFHNENFGVTGGAGDAGKAAVSTDGGKTWTQAASSGS